MYWYYGKPQTVLLKTMFNAKNVVVRCLNDRKYYGNVFTLRGQFLATT